MSTNYYESMADALSAQAAAHELMAEVNTIDPHMGGDDRMWAEAVYLNHAYDYRRMAITYRGMAAAWRASKGDVPVESFPF